MNTTMHHDPHFHQQYQKHLKCLKLGGLQPKTIDAYARAIRRIGNYFDGKIDTLTSGQLLEYFALSWGQVCLSAICQVPAGMPQAVHAVRRLLPLLPEILRAV